MLGAKTYRRQMSCDYEYEVPQAKLVAFEFPSLGSFIL